MADIRINALATTAASTASDDFIAVDGSANGTRKLNAYSPTFGGDLTVSGQNAYVGVGGTGAADAALRLNGSSATNQGAFVNFSRNSVVKGYLGTSSAVLGGSSDDMILYGTGSSKVYSGSAVAATFDGSQNTTLAGNLTVSGTGTSSFAGRVNFNGASGVGLPNNTIIGFAKSDGTANNWQIYCDTSNGLSFVNTGYAGVAIRMVDTTGNVLIGTTIDGGQKLQVAGTVAKTAAGPTTIAIASNEASNLRDEGRLFIVGNASAGSRYLGLEYYDVGNGAYRNVAAVPNGGNFLVGTTTDGGQKLQVSGTAAISGQIRGANIVASNLGSADTGFYGTAGADAGSAHRLALVRTDTPSGGSALLSAFGAAVVEVNATTGLNTGTRALTIDTSANATFAGSIAIGNTVQTAASVASTHKVTISIGGSTYYLLATNV
jgi:hypothetical protein